MNAPRFSSPGISPVSAMVLAAGRSVRMGRPKMSLPWGDTTVIGQVVRVLSQSGIGEIVVVTGGARQEVQHALSGLPVREVYNPDYVRGEMLSTFQTGLSALGEGVQAALITLGDQPQIELRVVESILQAYMNTGALLVAPSYRMHRGHPWLIDRTLWPAALDLEAPATLRDFLNGYQDSINYVPVKTSSVLRDLDTPAEYHKQRPKGR